MDMDFDLIANVLVLAYKMTPKMCEWIDDNKGLTDEEKSDLKKRLSDAICDVPEINY